MDPRWESDQREENHEHQLKKSKEKGKAEVSELSPGTLGSVSVDCSLPGFGITTFCTFSDLIIKGEKYDHPHFAR